MSSNKIHRVMAFVDWDTAFRIAISHSIRKWSRENVEHVLEALDQLCLGISCSIDKIRSTTQILPSGKVYVKWRIYHGWHAGNQPTNDFLAFDKAKGEFKNRTVKNITFGNDFGYGNHLLCGSSRGPLMRTSRRKNNGKPPEQKMVDTALVCDLLSAARTPEISLSLVISHDDDMIPGILCAEAWKANVVRLHRKSSSTNNTKEPVNLRGIDHYMEWN